MLFLCWGINSWSYLSRCLALQSITHLTQGRGDTERWSESGRDEGGPESADSSFFSAVPGRGQGAGREAEAKLGQHHCFMTLFPFLAGPCLFVSCPDLPLMFVYMVASL